MVEEELGPQSKGKSEHPACRSSVGVQEVWKGFRSTPAE